MSVSLYWCRTEQLLATQGASPERLGTNGHELGLFSQAMDTSQNVHLSGVSNNLVSFLCQIDFQLTLQMLPEILLSLQMGHTNKSCFNLKSDLYK